MRFARWGLIALCSVACAPRVVPGDRCESATDCAAPLVCRMGRCRTECTVQRDCPSFADCLLDELGNGSCRLPDDSGCTTASDCSPGLVCVDRVCSNPCESVTECPEGSLCVAGSEPGSRTRCVRADVPGLDVTIADAALDGGTGDVSADVSVEDGGHDAPEIVDAPEILDAPVTCTGPVCIVEVALAERNVCALTAAQDVFCWGSAIALGTSAPGTCGASPCATTPVPVELDDPTPPTGLELLTGVSAIAGSRDDVCAIRAGRVVCWGRITDVLGAPSDGSVARPVRRAVGFLEEVVSISMGAESILAVTSGTDTYVGWGDARFGQFGVGIEPSRDRAELVDPFPAGAHLTLGGWHGCGIDRGPSSHVWCWGENDLGQSAAPPALDVDAGGVPIVAPAAEVPGGPDEVIEVAPTRSFTCALTAGGEVWCWGWQYSRSTDRTGCIGTACPPEQIFRVGPRFVALAHAAHSDSACAIDEAGTLWCWGVDNYLPPDPGGAAEPRAVDGLPPVRAAYLSGNNGCAIDEDGALWCWGANELGQLGAGTFDATIHRTPMRVVFP